jgi:hypothetical protein
MKIIRYTALFFWFFICFCFVSPQSIAQEYDSLMRIEEQQLKDTLQRVKQKRQDSLKVVKAQKKIRRPMSNPLRAALLSAALPGAGQYYNKSWWWAKIPIFYGAFGFVGYNLYRNQTDYVGFRDSYLYSRDNNPVTIVDPKYETYNDTQLKAQRDRALRERDYNIVLLLVIYGLNIAEAATTAHLKGFDVSDDLSLQIQPKIFPTDVTQGLVGGLSFNFRFK